MLVVAVVAADVLVLLDLNHERKLLVYTFHFYIVNLNDHLLRLQ